MALRIKLVRFGKKHKPHYKIVVACQQKSRDSSFVEQLGIYSPSSNPHLFRVDRKRTDFWLKTGAKPTEAVEELLKKEKII